MSETQVLREHYKLIADIDGLREAVKDGKESRAEIIRKLDLLEEKARLNEIDHQQFVKMKDLSEMRDTLRQLKDGKIIMTPEQARDAGASTLAMILRNPTYVNYITLAIVVILMVLMGYNFIEISQVIEKMP